MARQIVGFLFLLAAFSYGGVVEISTTTMTFDELDTAIEITKQVDDANGAIGIIDPKGRILDPQFLFDLEEREGKQRTAKYGALVPRLARKVIAKSENDTFDVLIVPKHDPILPFDKTKLTASEIDDMNHSEIEKGRIRNPHVTAYGLQRRYETFPPSLKSPMSNAEDGLGVLQCRATKKEILRMALDRDIASIEEIVERNPAAVPLSTLVTSSYNSGNMVSRGKGVNNATFELGLTDSYLSCMGMTRTPDLQNGYGSDHTNLVFSCMKNTSTESTPHHFAENQFYSNSAQQFLINHNIKVASISYENPNDPLSYEARVMDSFSFRYPFPIFCNPSANMGYDLVSHWGSYNGLSVGNVQHLDQQHYVLNGCTQTTNPPARYGQRNDREMPYLVVPGFTPVNGVPLGANCVPEAFCGTSFSAPILNGICANVISAKPLFFNSWPEATRAVIMATAQNVDGAEWRVGLDGRDGVGVVSGRDAEIFAQTCQWLTTQNTNPYENAVYVGSLPRGTSALNFKIRMPSPLPTGKHLRVVLTWDSNARTDVIRNDLTDLDLSLTEIAPYYVSASWNSNNEIMDIPNSYLQPGKTYTARVSHTVDRIPAGGFTYVSVAWTWVKDHAN